MHFLFQVKELRVLVTFKKTKRLNLYIKSSPIYIIFLNILKSTIIVFVLVYKLFSFFIFFYFYQAIICF